MNPPSVFLAPGAHRFHRRTLPARSGRTWKVIRSLVGLICLAAHAAGGNLNTVGGVVRLPPFVVEQSRGPAWRYAELPGIEVLARCNDETTHRLALVFYRAGGLLDTILPRRFQLHLDAPRTLIFYDERLWPSTKQEMIAEITRLNPGFQVGRLDEAAPPAPNDGRVPSVYPPGRDIRPAGDAPRVRTSFFTNLQLADADSVMIFAMVAGGYVDPAQARLTPDYVATLVNGRVPALPDWLRDGFLGIYPLLKFDDRTIMLRVPRFAELEDAPSPTGGAVAPGSGLLPLEALFRGMPPHASDEALVQWTEEAKLFVCWGIDPSGRRTEAFWEFVDGCSRGQPAAEAFQACFGIGLAEATRQLATYNQEPHTLRWQLESRFAKLPPCSIREASRGEVARIKGEWERLETRYVKIAVPDLESTYRSEARRTLRRAYDGGDRDPRLLASLGLLECDAGATQNAREFLEAATDRGVTKPRAYFELARLRYNEGLDKSRRNDGKLEAEQTNGILQLLVTASHQAPPLPPVFELMADVATNSTAPTPPDAIAALRNGINLFPDDLELLSRVAKLQPPGELQKRADELIRRRAKATADSERRETLPSLRVDVGGRKTTQ